MKIRFHPPRRGFAVLVVMIALVVLSILAGALAIFMKVESQLTVNSNDSEKLLWLGRAGAERACWILAQEPAGPTSLKQIWAGGPGVGPETNSPLMGISLTGFQVGDGTVDLAMTEQESKFNINTADSQLLQQVLTTMGADASAISVVSDSIQDWIDPDDATRPAGAESDYYQGLTPPYNAKNAPIDDIEELQLIKGVTPLMFKGGSSADPNSPFQHHQLGFGNAPGQEDYSFGLRDVFTPYSSGKVNINTASSNVLACIPQMDDNTVAAILTLRDSEGDSLTGNGVISDLNQLSAAVPNPQALQQLQRYCTVSGNTYEVTITAHAGADERQFVAVIIRNGNRSQIVSFHPK
jgi:type II secretory pathway component PulK